MRVWTDRDEYCRYDPALQQITVLAEVLSGLADAGEMVHLSIRRVVTEEWPEAYCTIMTRALTATAGQTRFSATFLLGRDDRNAHHIALARMGTYEAQAR